MRYFMPITAAVPTAKRGLSLIEVLISMFVLLFGLMGVAAIFPVGNHYAARSERFDRAAALADNAFAELRARGLLDPQNWVYVADASGPQPVIAKPGSRRLNMFAQLPDGVGPGHAFVIDPLGVASGLEDNAEAANLDVFPMAYFGQNPDGDPNVLNHPVWQTQLLCTRWPIRRVTYVGAGNFVLPTRVAEIVFGLRDDLSIELPPQTDRPGVQRWSTVDLASPPTPDDPSNDILLARAYDRAYTWLATVSPSQPAGWSGLQPADPSHGDHLYDVSVVIFDRRDPLPGPSSERSLDAVMLAGNELIVYSEASNNSDAVDCVDAAVDEIREGEWMAVAGVHPYSGMLILKWYRILAIDNNSASQDFQQNGTMQSRIGRRLMLDGPDWPGTLPLAGQTATPAMGNLRAILVPDVASVATRPMKIDASR